MRTWSSSARGAGPSASRRSRSRRSSSSGRIVGGYPSDRRSELPRSPFTFAKSDRRHTRGPLPELNRHVERTGVVVVVAGWATKAEGIGEA
jgi:hypothetical protein